MKIFYKIFFSLDVYYKHIEGNKTFCKSEHNADWTTEELKAMELKAVRRRDLNWYIHYGNGVCNIGNNGGIDKCAWICKDVPGCRYFSVSTTNPCYACWIYKTCDNPISTDHDYKIYEMQKGKAIILYLSLIFFDLKLIFKTQ